MLRPLSILAMLSIFAAQVCAQRAPQVSRTTEYDMLFHEISAFQKMAANLRAENKSDAFIQNHHRNTLALSQKKFDALVRISEEYCSSVADLDKQANDIINAAKTQYKLSGQVPTAPAELKTLQSQREALATQGIQALQAAFGASDFLYFDANVRRYLSANYKVVPLAAPLHP